MLRRRRPPRRPRAGAALSSIDVAHQIAPYGPVPGAPPSPAPAPSPPALSSGGRTALRVLLVVLAALVSLGTLASLCALAFGLGSIRVVTDTQGLPASVRLLTVDTGDVPVVVRLTTDVDAKEPRVDLRVVTSTDHPQLAIEGRRR